MYTEVNQYAEELSFQIARFYEENYHELLNVVQQFLKGDLSQNELEVLFDSFHAQMHLVERDFKVNCRAVNSRKCMNKFLREWYIRRTG